MLHPEYPHVHVGALRKTVKKYHIIERMLAAGVLLGTVFLFLYWLQRFADSIPALGACAFVLTALWVFAQLEVPAGVSIEELSSERLGNFTVQGLKAIVRQSCASYSEREIPHIFLLPSAEGNAFVINVDVLNGIKRWNAVYISEHLLHTLGHDELEAVISHEMCHFSLHATFWNRYFYIQPLIFAVWTTFILSYPLEWVWSKTMGWIVFGLAILALGILGIVRLMWLLATFVAGIVTALSARPDSQEIESLCDYEAARRFGILPTINALLKIGSRQEIFSALLARLSPDESDPLRLEEVNSKQPISVQIPGEEGSPIENVEEKLRQTLPRAAMPENQELPKAQLDAMLAARSEAISQAYKHLAERLPPGFISLEESMGLVEEALLAADAKTYEHEPRALIRWLAHDDLIPNLRIDEEEYPPFLETLITNPDVPLFYIPEEFDAEKAKDADHPTLRDRILFLEFNRGFGLRLMGPEVAPGSE